MCIRDRNTTASSRRTASPRGVGPGVDPTGVASGLATATAEDAAESARSARSARGDIVIARGHRVGAHSVTDPQKKALGKKSTLLQTSFGFVPDWFRIRKFRGTYKNGPWHEGASSAAPMRLAHRRARSRTSTRGSRSAPTRWGAHRARRCALAIGTTRTRHVTGRDRRRRWWSPWNRHPRAGGAMRCVRRDARHAAPHRRR